MNINTSAALAPEISGPMRTLPSGRVVVLRTATCREELEVRTPDGQVEASF